LWSQIRGAVIAWLGEDVLGTEDTVCRICDRPILPGEGLVKVAHDVMHVACLPSTKRRAEEHGKAS